MKHNVTVQLTTMTTHADFYKDIIMKSFGKWRILHFQVLSNFKILYFQNDRKKCGKKSETD